MKIGCCTNMIATGADGTGVEFAPRLAELGFDYIELPLAEMSALSDREFEFLVKQVNLSGVRCEICNNFFPKDLRLTGPGIDREAVAAYVEKALSRAETLGAECVVFGSGPAKNVPEGFPMEKGYSQVVQLLREAGAAAERRGITIAIEPLRRQECNLVNTFAEGCRLAAEVDRENIRVLVDFYHLAQEKEPVENLLRDGKRYLYHVHFARNERRSYPADIAEDRGYRPFFEALSAIGYDRRVSLEAYTSDFGREAPAALEFFRRQFPQF